MRDRSVRVIWLAAGVLAVLALANFFIWRDIDAVDCDPSCTLGQDLSGLALVLLPVLVVILLAVGAVRWVLLRRRTPDV
jgi:hypothetical protein